MRQHPPAVAEQMAVQAANLLRERQNQAAYDLLVQITGPDEGSAADWYHLGIAEQRLDNKNAALTAYYRALELEPTFHRCLIAVSALEFKTLRWRSAWQHLTKAAKVD